MAKTLTLSDIRRIAKATIRLPASTPIVVGMGPNGSDTWRKMMHKRAMATSIEVESTSYSNRHDCVILISGVTPAVVSS